MNFLNIIPGEGLDAVQFGLTRDEVKALLGKPDEVETINNEEIEDAGLTEQWHYDELEISLSFDEIDNYVLTSIAVSGADYLFDEQPLIGLTMEEVLEFVEESDLGEPEGEELELLVIQDRRIFEVQADLGIIESKKVKGFAYGAVGSGAATALGALYLDHEDEGSIGRALEATEEHNTKVRKPFIIIGAQ